MSFDITILPKQGGLQFSGSTNPSLELKPQATGDLEFIGQSGTLIINTTGSISGSATSTGSFGQVLISGSISSGGSSYLFLRPDVETYTHADIEITATTVFGYGVITGVVEVVMSGYLPSTATGIDSAKLLLSSISSTESTIRITTNVATDLEAKTNNDVSTTTTSTWYSGTAGDELEYYDITSLLTTATADDYFAIGVGRTLGSAAVYVLGCLVEYS